VLPEVTFVQKPSAAVSMWLVSKEIRAQTWMLCDGLRKGVVSRSVADHNRLAIEIRKSAQLVLELQ
jgi:hypothetical protein